MPAGRPSKYKKEYCDLAIEYMNQGHTLCQFAAKVGVDPDTVLAWRKKYPEFHGAIKKAEKGSQAFWESILHRAAMGIPLRYKEADGKEIILKNYDRTLIIFLMKSRFRDTYGDQLNLSANEFEFKPLATLADETES